MSEDDFDFRSRGAQLHELVQRCLELYVGLEASVAAGLPPDASGRETVAACVHILGSWLGSISIEVDRELAGELTFRLFDLEPGSVPPDGLVGETLKEFANTIGGNIKAWFDGRCALSTPKGWGPLHGWAFSVPGSAVATEQWYTMQPAGHPPRYLVLRIHKSTLSREELEQI